MRHKITRTKTKLCAFILVAVVLLLCIKFYTVILTSVLSFLSLVIGLTILNIIGSFAFGLICFLCGVVGIIYKGFKM